MSACPIGRARRSHVLAALALAARVSAVPRLSPPTAASLSCSPTSQPRRGITFSHVSAPEKKYIVESMSGGVALFDFDKDGLLDVYLVNSPTVATAPIRRARAASCGGIAGDGTFVDVTDKAGVGYPGWGMGVATGDYDNDGWEDLYVTCFGANQLYRNNGDGTFADVTREAGVGDPRWSTGAASPTTTTTAGSTCSWPTTSTCGSTPCRSSARARPASSAARRPVRSARAAGRGRLAVPQQRRRHVRRRLRSRRVSRMRRRRFGMGVAWCDFNEDGWVDLFVANDSGPNLPLQEQRRRHVHGRRPRVGHGPQRGRRRAGLHGRRHSATTTTAAAGASS